MERLKVGDRVMQKGWRWRGEQDRFGVVVECYDGIPSAVHRGDPMVAIKWDESEVINRGYLNRLGSLEREPLKVPSFKVVPRVQNEKA